MASTMATPRRSAARAARVEAKRRRQWILAGACVVVLAALLAYEVPHTLKLMRPASSSVSASPSAGQPLPATSHTRPTPVRGSGADPFAARPLSNRDPRVAPAGGPDPFTAPRPTRSAKAAAVRLPHRIVIGRPGAHRVATHGWIVILASIPVGHGRGAAVSFARAARRSVGRISILNSSDSRTLRRGYWVVYTGPYATLAAVSHRADTAHAAGYRNAYLRELVRYR